MEEKIKISILCQLYGKLLTEKQYSILDDYYNSDLSLSEIAENNNITRQAVNDVINKGKSKLLEYEEKLTLMKSAIEEEKIINNVICELKKNVDSVLTKKNAEKIEKALMSLM